jgi:hypothetical protein
MRSCLEAWRTWVQASRLRFGHPTARMSSALAFGWRSPFTSLREIPKSQAASLSKLSARNQGLGYMK